MYSTYSLPICNRYVVVVVATPANGCDLVNTKLILCARRQHRPAIMLSWLLRVSCDSLGTELPSHLEQLLSCIAALYHS